MTRSRDLDGGRLVTPRSLGSAPGRRTRRPTGGPASQPGVTGSPRLGLPCDRRPRELRHNGVVKPSATSVTTQSRSGAPASADAPDPRAGGARSILEHGPSTAAELAERLGLTPAAVRRHLDAPASPTAPSRPPRAAASTAPAGAAGRPRSSSLTDAGRDTLLQQLRRPGRQRAALPRRDRRRRGGRRVRPTQRVASSRSATRTSSAAPTRRGRAEALADGADRRRLRRVGRASGAGRRAALPAPLPGRSTSPRSSPSCARPRPRCSPGCSACTSSASPPSPTATASAPRTSRPRPTYRQQHVRPRKD